MRTASVLKNDINIEITFRMSLLLKSRYIKMTSKLYLVFLLAAVVQINGRPQFLFGKKDNSEKKPLFGLPSLPNPIKAVSETVEKISNPLENVQDKIKNVAEETMGNLNIDGAKNMMESAKDILDVTNVVGGIGNTDEGQNESIIDIAKGKLDNVKEQIMDTVQDNIIVDQIKNIAGGNTDDVQSGNILDMAKEKLDNVKEQVMDKVQDNMIVDKIANIGGESENSNDGQNGNIIDIAKGKLENVKEQISNTVAGKGTSVIPLNPGQVVQDWSNAKVVDPSISIWQPSKILSYIASWFTGIPVAGAVMGKVVGKVESVQNEFAQNASGAGAAMAGLIRSE